MLHTVKDNKIKRIPTRKFEIRIRSDKIQNVIIIIIRVGILIVFFSFR